LERARVTALRLCFLAAAFAFSSCALSGPGRPQTVGLEPRWQDVIEATPDLLVAIRPLALRHDPGFGPLLQRIVDVGRQRSRVVADTRALEAMQDAEEVIIALHLSGRRDSDGESDELIVVRGVRADVDPGRLVDSEGQPLWMSGPSGPVRELLRAHTDDAAPLDVSLFELPARTWVIATGPARARARRVFTHPLGRPEPALSPDALVAVHVDGPTFVSRLPLRRRAGQLWPIGQRLLTLEITLPPSRERVIRVALLYADVAAADAGESAVRSLIRAVGGAKTRPTGWVSTLVSARVERKSDRSVFIECPWTATPDDDALRNGTDTPSEAAQDAGKMPYGEGPSL
jgi:hypothetical protein